jgi:hypothetical protein
MKAQPKAKEVLLSYALNSNVKAQLKAKEVLLSYILNSNAENRPLPLAR